MTSPLVVSSTGQSIALPGSDLFEEVRRKLVNDLGLVQVDRRGQERIYRPRAELLAEAVTPNTFVMVMDWLTSVRRSSLQTKRNYVDDIRRVWGGYAQELGHERFALGCFTADQIRTWRLRMEGRGSPPTTISRYLNALSSLHTYAAEKIDLPKNPVTQDDRPKVDKGNTSRSTPVLEVEEIQAVGNAAENEFDALVVLLLYTLAGRVTEMVAADVTDRIERGRRSYLDVTRKEHKERILPLPVTVAELLDAHTAGRTEGPLLLDADGRRLDRHDVARLLTRLGRKARVLTCPAVGQSGHAFSRCKVCRKLTPHVLRASRITHMLDAGEPLAEVQAFADHDNPATTVGYWNRRKKGERNAAHVDAAEALFSGIANRFHLGEK
ncbi:tyrosine-type recombinase/integrase [Streptomyces caniscabiei]|uniref:Tyrosine-type recombinase/integrase n=1 Tax=Streptomyces caniscabiei TaxID=2746961 RepID=A0A927KX83_9ACTN|nr:tyrosine-type recombinase/integrase [Streptomyces caniscabiei]MBD9722015.1 tyrosine-type recombinase/integrase [Streptomyces caniscabiei]MDX3509208.1 tyrosine-type recombinase/integrase [Streptomyces caniscabiei]MDX3717039.1 tyrosine-type recombinase/integrase [Streptomyces caniscabiei]WEO22908.1 tyrosine-type recombinase/integrase [Streptomyces caniscabiei]